MRSGLFFIGGLFTAILTFVPAAPSRAAGTSPDIPSWLQSHVGDTEGKITQVVLQRARSLYLRKVKEGAVKNACYFAMDATRPNISADNLPAARFYVICESAQSFRAIPAGHGSGRNIKGVVDFSNGRECAKNFGNAQDSLLTTGGAYVTSEARTSFKGYYRISPNDSSALVRAFVPFEGEGETANARQRDIGGHAAVVLKDICLRKFPQSPHADERGYVPFGHLVEYSGGRSDGCTSWSRPDAEQIVQLLKDGPTTVYIYPESRDIEAVAQAVAAHRSPPGTGPYWNAACLKQIGSPKFWPKELLEPILARERQQQQEMPPAPPPLCKGPSPSGE